jgi:four helix bundle protein
MSDKRDSSFDLGERTARFGEMVIQFVSSIRRTAVSAPLISQLVRFATSIGSNYCEADEAGSKKEFRYRVSVCCREARETKYWLRMIAAAVVDRRDDARLHWKEADEINRIFAAIHRKSNDSET